MIDRNCPPEILDQKGLPDLGKWTGMNYTAIKGLIELVDLQQLMLGSLTSRLQAAGIP